MMSERKESVAQNDVRKDGTMRTMTTTATAAAPATTTAETIRRQYENINTSTTTTTRRERQEMQTSPTPIVESKASISKSIESESEIASTHHFDDPKSKHSTQPIAICPISGERRQLTLSNDFHRALKAKMESAGCVSVCPVMAAMKSSTTTTSAAAADAADHCPMPISESPGTTIPAASGTPIDCFRPETPDEEKLDLRHLSLALMKLLYPKTFAVYQIIKRNVQARNNVVWERAAKIFMLRCSIDKLANDDDESEPPKSGITLDEREIIERTLAEASRDRTESNGCRVEPIDNQQQQTHRQQSPKSEPEIMTFDQLEQLAKYVAKKLSVKQELNWEELIVECGEQYATQCLECDAKSLKFVGDNLIDFLVNVENIQSIAYEEMACADDDTESDSPDGGRHHFWPPSQPDLLPFSVFVNHSETQIVITYNIQQPICRFVACFLSGLYRKMARVLFRIVIKVRVDIGSDQYKFVLENRHAGSSLVQDESFVSRYKKSLMRLQQHQLMMSMQTFSLVFPFHFICDQNLRFIQYGTGLRKVFGEQSKLQAHISNVFNIVQPNVGFFFESIRHRTNLAFILRIRDNIINDRLRRLELKGQIIECIESKCLLFLGSPIVKGLKSMTDRGLFLSDIPIHDATRDIILVEEQSRAQESLKRRMDKLKDSIQKANQAVEIERSKNVHLLNLIFPANVARCLWLGQVVEARQYDDVTMLFSDIVGFTSICSTATPIAIINMLNELYTQFDVFCGEVDVYKTETIGDAYCIASGIHRANRHHAVLSAFMALKMIDAIQNFRPKDIGVEQFKMRIGLHSGSCLTGIVGVKMPRYCLFGAHVTLANKFESHSEAQRVNVSPTTYRLLTAYEQFRFTARDPSSLPKDCPAGMERIANFVDDFRHPALDAALPLACHISKALEEILPKH